MKSKAFKMYLKPGMEEEYRRRHAEIWPELIHQLREEGVYDYSIFLDRATDTLFAVQKTRGGTGSQEMTDNALVRRWWDYMADVIVVEAERCPPSARNFPSCFTWSSRRPALRRAGDASGPGCTRRASSRRTT